MENRESLIKQMREAFTGDNLPDVKETKGSIYNASTGTLYCKIGSTEFEEKQIKDSIEYFERIYDACALSDDKDKKLKALYCKIAAESIKQGVFVNNLKRDSKI